MFPSIEQFGVHVRYVLSRFTVSAISGEPIAAVHTGSRTYYEILGVPRGAALPEIKKAYYEKSKQLHPDIASECSNPAELKQRNNAFIELAAAYEVLRVIERRQLYDMSLCNRKTYKCNGRTYDRSWECTEDSDGIFSDYECINRRKPSNLMETYERFWAKFGIFGECLRFLMQCLVIATAVVALLIRFCG